MTAPLVHVELPETWVRVPLAADGDRAGQRQLLQDWLGAPPSSELLGRLVRASRDAHRSGASFAAVLLGSVDGSPVGADRVVLSAALTVGFRPLPGATDARVAAEGVLQVLRRTSAPTRQVTLVGLAGEADRPAVLVTEQAAEAGRLVTRTSVLWLLPDTCRLAAVTASSEDLPLAAALRDVALAVAVSLRVGSGVRSVNA